MKQLTEDQFDEQYELVPNPLDENASFDGCMHETYGDELLIVQEMAKENRVITIIETDDDPDFDYDEAIENGDELPLGMAYVSGMHYVNRIGYLITKEPITEDFEVKLD
jgi:hypothetical protein